eukprot:166392-Alexandrium_andersonii.AAC.1
MEHARADASHCAVGQARLGLWGVPRALVDDLSVFVEGEPEEEPVARGIFTECCEVTGRYLADLGARVACEKCSALPR